MQYRPHIDGLRTIAVVPVVLFHIESNLVPGGFIGVDIFFVISGYLITSLLYKDMFDRTYSLLDFYKRRALRIFPALLFMLLGVALLSSYLLMPHEREQVGYSIAATSAFLSNFWFWKEAGYFSAAAESQPLLHTWSLAVEEQFYLFFPPFLYLVVRFARRHVFEVILGFSAVSLAASIVFTGLHQPTAFYLIPFRAWELGIGGGLAIATVGRRLPLRGQHWPAVVGLALVALPMGLLSNESSFPGWNAIAPVLGTTLIIGWGAKGFVGWLLSWGPMVFVGRVSYSFYLWHWPVIVFWKLSSGTELDPIGSVSVFALSFFLAWLSTTCVERPFRTAKARNARSGSVVLTGMLVLVAMVAVGILSARGIPQLRSYPPQAVEIASVANYAGTSAHEAQFRKGEGSCFIGQGDGGFEGYNQDLCTSPDSSRLNVLLIGDSHAAQYWRSIQDALSDINIMQANASGCRWLDEAPGSNNCVRIRDWIFEDYLPKHRVDAVILVGRWREEETTFVGPTLDLLFDFTDKVIVFGPVPEYDGALPLLLSQSVLRGTVLNTEEHIRVDRFEVNRKMRAVVEAAGAYYVDVLSKLCKDEISCTHWASDGAPLQFDYGHLTLSGASDLIKQIAPDLERYMTQ